jgi:Fe-S oxidoreductase/nitrate reductase gamma subunit
MSAQKALPFRELYWNVPIGKYLIYLFVVVASAIFFYGVWRRIKMWRQGKAEAAGRFDGLFSRTWWAGFDVFTQRLVLWELIPGFIHALIFFGFLMLFVGTIIVALEADFGLVIIGRPSEFYLWFTVVLNLFGLAAIAGVLFAFVRRYVVRSVYLDNKPDDAFVLWLLLLILVSGHLIQAVRLAVQQPWWAPYSFLSFALSVPLERVDPSTLRALHGVLWWLHFFLVMFWLAYLPFSKLWHIFAGALNLFFRSHTPRGRIKKMNLEDENAESFGLAELKDFTWKQLLDADACIRCGRCQENCPAKLTNKSLNPRKLIQDVKEHMEEACNVKQAQTGNVSKNLHGGRIPAEVLWDCTTCRACEANCPMGVEHLDAVIGMRQYLTLTESSFPKELTVVFKGMENNGNPWSLGGNKRFDWADGLGLKPLSSNPECEILFWVGCAGSYDDRSIKVTKAFVKILQAAHVKFGVLGIEEKCCGDTARRAGNEYLAQALISSNVETLNRYGVKEIVTTCPHGYNTLKNEYPDFGGAYRVFHHTEYIARLIQEGRLRFSNKSLGPVAIHDSCYLGRYNEVFDPPRRVLRSLPGLSLREASRNRRKGFCCGAGGARMWMEEKMGSRVNDERTVQLMATGARMLAVACPYCLTMITDGLKGKDATETHKVADVAELVASHLEDAM